MCINSRQISRSLEENRKAKNQLCVLILHQLIFLKSIMFFSGASLVVQWLRICLPMQGDTGSSPGLGRSHMPRSD